jgi:hypothetical protein
MDELPMDRPQSGGHIAQVNRSLAELHFLVMQAQQEKEKRRLVIATLEALVGIGVRSCRMGEGGFPAVKREHDI